VSAAGATSSAGCVKPLSVDGGTCCSGDDGCGGRFSRADVTDDDVTSGDESAISTGQSISWSDAAADYKKKNENNKSY
jgi:hypothetical protein